MHKTWKKFIDICCSGCQKTFSKELREYSRQIKNNPKAHFYCSDICLKSKYISKYRIINLTCNECGKVFQSSTDKKSNKKFCSRSCFLLYRQKSKLHKEEIKQIEIKKKIKNGQKLRVRPSAKVDRIFNCLICNKEFVKHLSINDKPRKTCSKECYKEFLHQSSMKNPNCGGETNFKRYKYKNITMDSSWEVELAKWLDESKIEWIRSRKICLFWKDELGNLRRYYPDFYLPDYNIYLDPKNKYLQEKDKFKLENIREQNIVVFSGYLEDIKNKLNNLF